MTTSATSSAVIIPSRASSVRPRPGSSAKSVATPPGQLRATNPALTQVVIERTRETDLTELRGAVDRLAGEASAPGLRGERDDVPLVSEHVRQRGARRVQRPFEVDVDHLFEVLDAELEKRRVGTDTSVRDEDVDPAKRSAVRSHTTSARRGCARRSAGRRRQLPRSSPLREARPRFTPRACRIRATAAPMPRLAPETTAVFPCRLM